MKDQARTDALDTVPSAPRVPSDRARTLVFGWQGGQRMALILGAVFTLIGVPLSAIFGRDLPEDLAIAASHRSAHGLVRSAVQDRSVKVNGRHPTLVRFSYEVEGVPHEGTASTLDSAVMFQAQPGERVAIEIATLRPDWARLEGSTASPFGYVGLIVLAFPLIGLGVLLTTIVSKRRTRAVFVSGTPVGGVIIGAGFNKRVRINGRNPFEIVWAFDLDGKGYVGKLSAMDPALLSDFTQGTSVVVVYDERKPSVNTLYME